MCTDNCHEFQSKFHWHADDNGIIHRYIKPASPHLNGKVERSHLTDHQEFYQLLNYSGDRNLNRQLSEWEAFYNYHRAHTSLEGKDALRNTSKKVYRLICHVVSEDWEFHTSDFHYHRQS